MTAEANARPPRPGHGTVFVTLHPDGSASATWQDEQRSVTFRGPPDDVLAWAREQPAGRLHVPPESRS